MSNLEHTAVLFAQNSGDWNKRENAFQGAGRIGMQKVFILLAFVGAVGTISSCGINKNPAVKAPTRVMSFNIRFNNPVDGDNAWPNRKEMNRLYFCQQKCAGGTARRVVGSLEWQIPFRPSSGAGRVGFIKYKI